MFLILLTHSSVFFIIFLGGVYLPKQEGDSEKNEGIIEDDQKLEPEPETTLYIKNLSFTTSEQRVKQVLR